MSTYTKGGITYSNDSGSLKRVYTVDKTKTTTGSSSTKSQLSAISKRSSSVANTQKTASLKESKKGSPPATPSPKKEYKIFSGAQTKLASLKSSSLKDTSSSTPNVNPTDSFWYQADLPQNTFGYGASLWEQIGGLFGIPKKVEDPITGNIIPVMDTNTVVTPKPTYNNIYDGLPFTPPTSVGLVEQAQDVGSGFGSFLSGMSTGAMVLSAGLLAFLLIKK